MTLPAESKPAGIEPATPLPGLRGQEPFTGLHATVDDFWQFALSDLRMNNTRGYLAEFLVSRALGLDTARVEWDNVDVLWGEIRIEVKSSAYVQAWPQRRPSRITFTGLRARSYDTDAGTYAAAAS